MRETKIQWTHSTINPVMGCRGCELWPKTSAVKSAIIKAVRQTVGGFANNKNQKRGGQVSAANLLPDNINTLVDDAIGDQPLSAIFRYRRAIAWKIAGAPEGRLYRAVVDAISESARCYAGRLGVMRAGHAGYAEAFEKPKVFLNRMAAAAKWGLPSPEEIAAKPWLDQCRRLIFISDMGDALSEGVSFDYLITEIIANVTSANGRRHIWQWLTKRPGRMAEFSEFLAQRGIPWPENLVAMTSVTNQKAVGRIDQLRRIPAKLRGLSVEPLFEPVTLDLRGIHWVIVGGASGSLAARFDLEWALSLRDQCKAAGTAFFVKQLGRNPFYKGKPLKLRDKHGGDWNEWPAELRIREVPAAFKLASISKEVQLD